MITDRYIYLACIGLSFILAYYGVQFVSTRKGPAQKTVTGCFVLVTLSLGVYSNLRCQDWKDTVSIKKEIRELLEKREDYVPAFKDLMKEEGEEMKETEIDDDRK